ncbi:hypothetical protein IWW36_003879 [Coemansia brasiliensis]|uniref:GBD/FH3 domain-containing protein n=1 Tax=Coemansia brasiliensis TaxID=2650707 RepID=A0A9W8LY45_9FUNG|nr:hypothetical protein IWW36_003879 [Coemansia brasiliensis]
MRLPFSLHRSTKSSDNFVQLVSSEEKSAQASISPNGAEPTSDSNRARGVSVSSSTTSIMNNAPVRSGRVRPISGVFSHAGSPSGELHLAQIEEELDTIMDSMGLQGEQRMAMKNMPIDNKVQLIHTHKMQAAHSSKEDAATPLSEHLKILARAGTQSLPLARLEKLRVDISYQSINQINTFIDEGGLRLLLTHLSQLNEKRTASRRTDELLKEQEIQRCVLGVAKVRAGAAYLLDGSMHIRRVVDSLGTMWLPCAMTTLRILSLLVQNDNEEMHNVSVILSSLFRRESALSESSKRQPVFVEWMETVDDSLAEYPVADRQTRADVVGFMALSLTLITGILSALAPSLDRRVKFYEKLASHDMLVKFAGLRKWKVSILETHLNRWDEMLRRDYNISRSQRADSVVLENSGVDSSVRNMALFQSFAGHYEEMQAARSNEEHSDNDDEYLSLATYAQPPQPPQAKQAASAPATPAVSMPSPESNSSNGAQNDAANTSSTNPFFAARTSRPESPIQSPAQAEISSARTAIEAPFMAHSRSHSSIVAETGCLRSLRSPNSNRDRSLSQISSSAAQKPADFAKGTSSLSNIKSACELLQKSLDELPKDIDEDVCRDLNKIVQVAQTMLSKAQKA